MPALARQEHHMNNPVGYFLNLDQGDMTDEQVVQMLASIGYQCIEYGLNHLNPRSKSSAQLRLRMGRPARVRPPRRLSPP